MMKGIEFLKEIYSKQCNTGDYIVLSVKGGSIKWRDVPIKYNPKTLTKELKSFFKQYPKNEYDLYFSPMPYSGPNRRLINFKETKYLFADLDEKSTSELKSIKKDEIQPRYLWESSPGKYQCMVELDRYVEQEVAEKLNKGLETHYDADTCGDLTHVIRIPGTVNHKYKNKPDVKEADELGKPLRPARLLKKLKPVEEPKKEKPTNDKEYNATERQIYAKYNIPQNIRELLALSDLTGHDRSTLMWQVESKLIEIGMQPKEILTLMWNSAFNKYKTRKDGMKRLETELQKIIDKKIVEPAIGAKKTEKLKLTSYKKLMSTNKGFNGWLVKGFWGRKSHGIVAGMPKSFKSTLVHDLAVSVASGKPFLGKYAVEESGPVLIVQNENADHIMRDRTSKIVAHKGCAGSVQVLKNGKIRLSFGEDLPIHMVNQQGFLLTNESHREQLKELIAEIKPVLVIMDPLYLMFDGDLNNAGELNPVLNWLLQLKNDCETSVMLIHHYNKGSAGGASKGGSRMSGSIFLYGWVESAWYLCREDMNDDFDDSEDDQEQSLKPSRVSLKREFRFAGHHNDVLISLTMGSGEYGVYDVETCAFKEGMDMPRSIVEEIMDRIKTSSSKKLDIVGLSIMSKKSQQEIEELLCSLCETGYIVQDKVGYYRIKEKEEKKEKNHLQKKNKGVS